MRLDLFLKLSRLCSRRAVARQLCDAGVVLLNGRKAKCAHAVQPDDTISIRRRSQEIVVRVLNVPAARSVSRQDAARMIRVVSETPTASIDC